MVLETVEASEWQVVERWWIAHYRMLGPLSNITDGGDAMCVAALSPEMVRKAADARRKSPKWAAARKQAADKIRGRKHSIETKEKMSASAKGRRPSDATVAAVGARYRGKKLTPDHAAKCAKGRLGKPNSSEHRAKQREAMGKHQAKQSSDQAARWRDPEYRARMLASMAGRKLTDTQKKRLAETTKRAWRDPQSREKRMASLLVASKNPEVRARNSAAVKAKWADPVWRARRKAAEAKRKHSYLQMEA
jgi:hypothetical protein